MTFGPDHYVPVLKVKRGEKKALLSLSDGIESRLTPLLEIVERNEEKASTIEAHLKNAFQDLARSVQRFERCFLDARELKPDGAAAADDVFQRATDQGIVFTPVTGVSRSVDVVAALGHRKNGIAIRLTRDELEGEHLRRHLLAFITKHALDYAQIDLIMDLGPVNDLVPDGVARLTETFLSEVPHHQRWRTFIVSACAFPSSMGGVDRNSNNLVPRSEWIAWRADLHANRHRLSRLPTFSDCVIQHSKGVEGFNPRTMKVAAAVRYTLAEDWLLIKGESTAITPPTKQFPALGTQLVYGHLRKHYFGSGHCVGCSSIRDAADGAPRLGSAEVWRQLGTVHHMKMVTEGLASLPWP